MSKLTITANSQRVFEDKCMDADPGLLVYEDRRGRYVTLVFADQDSQAPTVDASYLLEEIAFLEDHGCDVQSIRRLDENSWEVTL
jgi:hypothetical protein